LPRLSYDAHSVVEELQMHLKWQQRKLNVAMARKNKERLPEEAPAGVPRNAKPSASRGLADCNRTARRSRVSGLVKQPSPVS
jgi:hypothetical protein